MAHSGTSKFRSVAWLVVLLLAAAATGPRAEGQATSGYSEYFIPGPEGSNTGTATQLGMWWVFDNLDDANANGDTTMHSVITVTAWSSNSTIYYDHWENGLGFDPNNPSTADETYVLASPGSQRTFESSNIPTTPRGTATYYDGGDRIFVAGGTVTVSRASWIEGVGAGNQAVAWEIYPVKPQLTTYVIPFGENLPFAPFARVYALIQATANNTTFTVDYNADGTPDLLNQNHDGDKTDAGDIAQVTLQAGQTFLLDRVSACPNGGTQCGTTPGTLNSGAIIQGSSTLQVKFVAGDPGRNYCARGLSAFPRGYWTKDYYAPLDQPTGVDYNTDYYLHNPHTVPLTVNWESRTLSGSFSIPANTTISYRATAGAVPVDSGLYFKGSDVFWGVGINDSGDVANGATFEWGYSLLPSTFLYTEHYLGWAPGYASWAGGSATNYDDVGVFLTVAQDNTRVFVDLDNDGTPDQTYNLDRLQTQFIYDPTDGDLSQAHIWATGLFSMAFGENRDTAETSNPSLDLGYVAIPGTDFISLVLDVDKSVSPQVVPAAAGSRATFTIEVTTKSYAVDGVSVFDLLPPNWAYVAGSAEVTLPDLTKLTDAAADPVTTPPPTYADLFGSVSYSNNDSTPTGTLWTTDWREDGETNGPGTDNVRVMTDGGVTPNVTALRFRNSGANGRALARMADLSAFPGGELRFLYRRNSLNAAGDRLDVQVCATAVNATPIACSTGWVNAPAISGPTNDAAYQPYSVDLRTLLPSTFNSASFAVRFSTMNGSTLGDNDYIWIDDIRIAPPNGSFFWPPSTLGDLAPNQRVRITFEAETTTALTLGTLSQNRTVASATRTVGSPAVTQSFSATDFAYVATGDLQITKQSSASTPLYPGDQFAYTVTVTNPSGGATQNRLALFDALPPGLTAVPGTAVLSRSTAADAFDTVAFTNNQGSRNWSSGWAEVDSGGAGAAGGLIQVTGGALRLNNAGSVATQSVTRGVNLTGSGATQATLVFNYATSGDLDAADVMTVQYRQGGAGAFNTLGTFTDDGSGIAAFTVPLATPANLTEVRLAILAVGAYTGATNYFYVDNLSLTYNQPFTTGNPPDLLPGTYLYALAGNQSLTATFNVTVNDPFPAGSTLLTNTAATTSAQLPVQLTASVTNPVTVPSVQSASVAGRVWLDADGDGVQDIGEPGLGNVEVTLKDQFGTPIATLTTNANGRYLFTGVTPGNGYYVEVASGLPAGVSQSYPLGRTDDRTASFDLAEGQNYTGADLGYKPQPGTATFGDLTWVDADNDQVKDLGEIGLGGVRVRLYRDFDGDGFLAPLVDTLVGEPAAGPGSVNVTNASTTVTGVSTRFTTLAAGDPITIAGVTYSIASVTSDTQLVLGSAYTGTTGTARPYAAGTSEGPGTVAATNGSATVTGTGTTFTSLQPGDPIVIRGVRYRVQTVTSDTLLTLTSNFTGTTGTGLPYGLANATFSAADGSYLFTGAPATGAETYFVSAAAPAGYISTTGSVSRFQAVAAGSVLLTADFGFRSSGTTYSISDRIWLDADAEKDYDGGATEPGIGGVTVSLLDASLNVIGTTTTAGDGTFTFSGLTGGGADYTVRVSDATGVLADFTGTTEYATARERAEPNLSGDVDRRTAAAWPNGPSYGFLTTRAIGDSVYYDVNGNGSQDPGENGFAGVPVSLYRDVNGDDTLSLSAKANVTVTNGSVTVTGTGFLNYHAGEPVMIAGALYTIQSVGNDTTLTLTTAYTGATGSQTFLAPSAGPGTVGVTNGSATVTGSGFLRYRAGEPITINNGGTNVVYTILSIGSDTSLTLTATYAGTTNAARTYYGPGDALVGSVTTDATGQFLFAGLPARDYVVSVPAPAGYNYIPGTRTDTDGTAPGIQLAATVSGSANVLDRDFGFQAPAAGGIQGTIWNDGDGDGTIDGAETERFAGVTVEVLSGSTVVATLTTDANGFYSVAGLAAGSYTVRVTDTSGILTGNLPTTSTSLSVTVTANNNSTADFGFRRPTPTYAAVSYLRAFVAGGTVVVEWQTTQEVGTVGFDLLRLDPKSGEFVPVHDSLLPGLLGHPEGGTYSFQDAGAPLSAPLTYLLVEVDARGTSREYGPYLVSAFGTGAAPAARYQRTPGVISREDAARVATLKRERGATVAGRNGQKGPSVKVATREAGLHFLDSASLAALLGEKPNSFASRVGSGRVVVENLGAAVPYSPAAGGSGLYFYAEKMESPYTAENVYWVAARKGTMMATSNGSPTGRTPEAAFRETVRSEVDRYPLPVFFQDPEADFYTWDYFYAGYPGEDTRTFSALLPGVAGTGQPTLTVRLQGGSDTAAPDEHRVRITWNGRVVGEATWDGLVPYELSLPLGAADVVEGGNTLVLTAILEPGLEYDVVYLDSFGVSYERVYRAVGDELSFTLPAGAEAAVAGFSSPGAVLLDVTQPSNPVLVTGATTFAPGDGTFGLRLANRGAAAASYLAVVPARAKAPASMTPGRTPVLKASTNGADYLLIAPSSLVVAAESLAAYRRSRGFDTKVVDLADVYDEFGYGLETPIATRNFLAWATNEWSRAPEYVTLVGRGTFDYKDVQGVGDNVMPTLLAGTPYGLAASDVSFAELTTTAGPGVKAIGRLPVLTSQELLDYVAKVQAHEAAPAAAWQHSLLLTADNPDAGGAFTADSDAVGALAPPPFLSTKVYLTSYSADAARTAVRSSVNAGTLLFNYIGHGGPDRLADESFFNKGDVPFLTNSGRLPVFLAMTCSTGNFAIPGFPSLGESIVLWKSGGAYAVWAPSGLSLNDGARELNEAFFQGAFVDGEKVVGRNCTKALEGLPATGPTSYMKAIYNIIGEPVSRLP